MAKAKDPAQGGKAQERSKIFRDPDNLPSINEVLKEFQRLRNRPLRVSPNVMDISVDTREEGADLNVRLQVASKVLSPGGDVGAWCVLCDKKDNCTKCDAFDCIGCDAEELHSQEDIVSNPAPMTKEITIKTRRI